MLDREHPSLNLAVAKLAAADDRYAIWVLRAPYPGGYMHHDSTWPPEMTRMWLTWQNLFATNPELHSPPCHHHLNLQPFDMGELMAGSPIGQTSGLMQNLGLRMWQWLFPPVIDNALAQSLGISIGQNKPLRLRLEIREPDLIPLPWEIICPQPAKPAVSLGQQLLFSRTTSDVDRLPPQRHDRSLRVLLVLGSSSTNANNALDLNTEAQLLARIFRDAPSGELMPTNNRLPPAPCQVDILVQPSPTELVQAFEREQYNLFFYAGHGLPSADGGTLLLSPDARMNGPELAQILVRHQVKLAAFNSCWGAQPERSRDRILPRSSLAEVLLHHGVPAVLAMRDTIADREALTFVQSFSFALVQRLPIDEAVSIARQQLLTLYKFNQPAWTLPVLYMHPEFNGELIKPISEDITVIPSHPERTTTAYLRRMRLPAQKYPIYGGLIRIGRSENNDLQLPQEPWVSQRHAEIIYRDSSLPEGATYFLRDFSRFGSLIMTAQGWQKVHHQEVPIHSGATLKFGSEQGESIEFVVD
jgi:hypothetical protein